MYYDFTFPSVTEALPCLLGTLLRDGEEIGSRVGRTQELTHVGICLTDPLDREILVAERKPNLAHQIVETMWVLAGRDDIAILEHYLPRVREFSDDGETWRAGYGKRLRRWEDHGNAQVVDQWRWLVKHLQEDRGSRRAVMSIWDPIIDTQPGKDIPCNDWLSFLSRSGRLDLHVALRSNDVLWGWSGMNQFEWSALLEITAGMLGVKVGSLHFSTTSLHLYDHHFAKAQKVVDAGLTNLDHLEPSPRFDASAVDRNFDRLQALFDLWFSLEYDIRTGSPMVDWYIDQFPEPMLKSWLRVLQWYWSRGVRQDEYLAEYAGTRLAEATKYAIQPPRSKPVLQVFDDGAVNITGSLSVTDLRNIPAGTIVGPNGSPFIEYAIGVHIQKHNAYGDSWKKRGEKFSILPNVGRKIDRLGQAETDDETSADTVMDLMVYLAKYTVWLEDRRNRANRSDDPHWANALLRKIEKEEGADRLFIAKECFEAEDFLRSEYENLLQFVEAGDYQSVEVSVDLMLRRAYLLAHTAWESQQDEYKGADVD